MEEEEENLMIKEDAEPKYPGYYLRNQKPPSKVNKKKRKMYIERGD